MYLKKTLSFTADGREYISKPFDFEAMCLVNDNHIAGKRQGPLRMCRDALEYMFDGVIAGGTLEAADISVIARLCMEVWDMYAEALAAGGKKEKSAKNK